MNAQVAKQADIRFRVERKSRPLSVIYKVRSSDDTQTYDVTVVPGKVNNCTCPARKPCYHMHDVQAHEDARRQAIAVAAMNELAAEMQSHRPLDERGSLNHTQRGFQLMR